MQVGVEFFPALSPQLVWLRYVIADSNTWISAPVVNELLLMFSRMVVLGYSFVPNSRTVKC